MEIETKGRAKDAPGGSANADRSRRARSVMGLSSQYGLLVRLAEFEQEPDPPIGLVQDPCHVSYAADTGIASVSSASVGATMISWVIAAVCISIAATEQYLSRDSSTARHTCSFFSAAPHAS